MKSRIKNKSLIVGVYMSVLYEQGQRPEAYAEQVFKQADAVLSAAVEIVYPGTNKDPLEAFPSPEEVRANSPPFDLTQNQNMRLVEVAHQLGFGSRENVTLSEQRFIGAHVIIEGGQPHKMAAEAQMTVEDLDAKPLTIFFSASPHRKLKEAEVASAKHVLGMDEQAGYKDKTEYDVASDVAHRLPGFIKHDNPQVWAAGYDIYNDFAVSSNPTEQFVEVGTVDGIPVVLMKIDRHNLSDNDFDNQPDTADVIRIVDGVIRAQGDDTSPLAQVTSGTYPSRALGVVRAGLSVDRSVGIASYGLDLLAGITGKSTLPPINQLPGELYVLAQQANRLRDALGLNLEQEVALVEAATPPQSIKFWSSFKRFFAQIVNFGRSHSE
jgi:hypothetical protein